MTNMEIAEKIAHKFYWKLRPMWDYAGYDWEDIRDEILLAFIEAGVGDRGTDSHRMHRAVHDVQDLARHVRVRTL